jgi:tRNA-splicing ligase RtcB
MPFQKIRNKIQLRKYAAQLLFSFAFRMNHNTMTGTQLLSIGFPEGKAIGLALEVWPALLQSMQEEEALALLQNLASKPEAFNNHALLGEVASALAPQADKIIPLRPQSPAYAIYGDAHIDQLAREQMNIAMRLPVTAAGALMPDAHAGYGLPIGGVLATKNAVIPYGVGVDIGCRMALSVFDIPEAHFFAHEAKYKRELIAHTKFGAGNGFKGNERADHAVLESPVFDMNALLRQLRDKAFEQLGSSGGGNHFVEFGIIEFAQKDEALGIEKGRYLALLTHSGSRGLGATLAGHYTKLAKSLCPLPKEAANLAYLDLHTEEGQEYWLAMNLAGDYASACHEVIHHKIAAAIGAQTLAKVENHHNFAWKEMWQGEEVIVHRKGATPAGKGVMGIIPGSMTAPGFLVRGKGEANALHSASHGAGRQMSRTKAENTITQQQMKDILKANGVTLIGGGLDEAPMAYKDIHAVMAAQTDLVDIVAAFTPKMVRMADDGSRED